MQAKIQRWGNSLAIRIPKAFAEEVGLTQDSAVELRVIDGELHVVRVQPTTYDLKTLLDGVTDDNLHGEIDSGDPVGKETW